MDGCTATTVVVGTSAIASVVGLRLPDVFDFRAGSNAEIIGVDSFKLNVNDLSLVSLTADSIQAHSMKRTKISSLLFACLICVHLQCERTFAKQFN